MDCYLKLFLLKWAEGNLWSISARRDGHAERHSAYPYQHFYEAYKFIVITLEAIAQSLHRDLSSIYSDASRDADSKTNTNSLVHGVNSLLSFWSSTNTSHTGITVKLESSILEAYQQIEVKCFYKRIRKKIQADFSQVYKQSERMAGCNSKCRTH